ncbi:hypothetical protein ACWDV4_28310 [Micromonospora sp. NPDC003197]
MRFRPAAALRRAALLLATSILAIGAVGVAAAPASAGPIGSCKNLRSFVLEFRTGGDDLRYNSEVITWLTTTSGTVELQHVWGTFGGNSSTSRNVTFLNPNWTVNSCTVTGVQLRMVSHPEWYETADNWNMDGFALYGYSATGAYGYHVSAVGAPVKRFTGSDQWLTIPG